MEPQHIPSASPVEDISTELAIESCEPSYLLSDQTDDQYDAKVQNNSIVLSSFENHYTDPNNLRALEIGGCLFSFACKHQLSSYETKMLDSVVNLSAFDDETTENFAPNIEYAGLEENYTFLLTRCAYLLVGADINELLSNPSIVSTYEYQRSCQPVGTTVWNDYEKMEPNNFRITKAIIPYVYYFTIQFRVSGLSTDTLSKLSRHIGIRVDGGILLERTKRSVPPKMDATIKTKSVLLYTDLGKSVTLVTHLTVVVQQGLPQIIEAVIDTVGQWGLKETCETAYRTRKYLRTKMPAAMPKEQVFFDVDSPDDAAGDDDGSENDTFYDVDEEDSRGGLN